MRCLSPLLHLFFPHTCAGCGSDQVLTEQVICAGCMARLPYTGFMAQEGNPVEKLFYGRLRVRAGGSTLYFTRPSLVQHILTELKYRQHKQAGTWLGKLMAQQLMASGRFNHITALVPVPLHRKKERQRGYNQAKLLAEGISSLCGWPVLTDVIGRQAFTESQTHKDRVSRMANLKQVFTLSRPAALQGQHVLLIDDVITTGATLEACGQAILPASPASLNIATAAYTLL